MHPPPRLKSCSMVMLEGPTAHIAIVFDSDSGGGLHLSPWRITARIAQEHFHSIHQLLVCSDLSFSTVLTGSAAQIREVEPTLTLPWRRRCADFNKKCSPPGCRMLKGVALGCDSTILSNFRPHPKQEIKRTRRAPRPLRARGAFEVCVPEGASRTNLIIFKRGVA